MPRPPKSSLRDSRADVLSAARAEFAARGFSGAGVDRIALQAGVNKAMIYYHFADKLALYRAVLAEGLSRMGATVSAIASATEAPPELVDSICFRPGVWPNWRSSGAVTEEAITSGLAPG